MQVTQLANSSIYFRCFDVCGFFVHQLRKFVSIYVLRAFQPVKNDGSLGYSLRRTEVGPASSSTAWTNTLSVNSAMGLTRLQRWSTVDTLTTVLASQYCFFLKLMRMITCTLVCFHFLSRWRYYRLCSWHYKLH